jgi:hypothetical protein
LRKLLGWDRYDSLQAQAAINALYRQELRLMMNLYQPSVKLVRKTRVGARLRRTYDCPQTPLDRLLASGVGDPTHLRVLQRLRCRLDPFALAAAIDRKLTRIYRLANRRHSPRLGAVLNGAVSSVALPSPRRWNHDWLFQPRLSRRHAVGAPVRT